LIADSDSVTRRALRLLVSAEGGTQVVGEASTGPEALELAGRAQPDLALLDAELPGVGGIEVARRFSPERAPAVMFLAGNDRHAADAFGVDALDYVVKPLTSQRFRAVMERLHARIGTRPPHPERSSQSASASASDGSERSRERAAFGPRMWVHSRGQVQVVDVDQIEWIESDLRYSWIHLRNGERRRLREPISSIEQRLDPARFARVHRSVIVNLDSVAEAISSAKTKAIILKNGTRLPMSRSRKHNIFSPAGAVL
jgi:two-component system LytT family response regulator